MILRLSRDTAAAASPPASPHIARLLEDLGPNAPLDVLCSGPMADRHVIIRVLHARAGAPADAAILLSHLFRALRLNTPAPAGLPPPDTALPPDAANFLQLLGSFVEPRARGVPLAPAPPAPGSDAATSAARLVELLALACRAPHPVADPDPDASAHGNPPHGLVGSHQWVHSTALPLALGILATHTCPEVLQTAADLVLGADSPPGGGPGLLESAEPGGESVFATLAGRIDNSAALLLAHAAAPARVAGLRLFGAYIRLGSGAPANWRTPGSSPGGRQLHTAKEVGRLISTLASFFRDRDHRVREAALQQLTDLLDWLVCCPTGPVPGVCRLLFASNDYAGGPSSSSAPEGAAPVPPILARCFLLPADASLDDRHQPVRLAALRLLGAGFAAARRLLLPVTFQGLLQNADRGSLPAARIPPVFVLLFRTACRVAQSDPSRHVRAAAHQLVGQCMRIPIAATRYSLSALTNTGRLRYSHAGLDGPSGGAGGGGGRDGRRHRGASQHHPIRTSIPGVNTASGFEGTGFGIRPTDHEATVSMFAPESPVNLNDPAVLEDDEDAENTEESLRFVQAGSFGAFVHGLEDEYADVRIAALDALELFSLESETFALRALDLIVGMFSDEIDAVRVRAMRALRSILRYHHARAAHMNTVLPRFTEPPQLASTSTAIVAPNALGRLDRLQVSSANPSRLALSREHLAFLLPGLSDANPAVRAASHALLRAPINLPDLPALRMCLTALAGNLASPMLGRWGSVGPEDRHSAQAEYIADYQCDLTDLLRQATSEAHVRRQGAPPGLHWLPGAGRRLLRWSGARPLDQMDSQTEDHPMMGFFMSQHFGRTVFGLEEAFDAALPLLNRSAEATELDAVDRERHAIYAAFRALGRFHPRLAAHMLDGLLGLSRTLLLPDHRADDPDYRSRVVFAVNAAAAGARAAERLTGVLVFGSPAETLAIAGEPSADGGGMASRLPPHILRHARLLAAELPALFLGCELVTARMPGFTGGLGPAFSPAELSIARDVARGLAGAGPASRLAEAQLLQFAATGNMSPGVSDPASTGVSSAASQRHVASDEEMAIDEPDGREAGSTHHADASRPATRHDRPMTVNVLRGSTVALLDLLRAVLAAYARAATDPGPALEHMLRQLDMLDSEPGDMPADDTAARASSAILASLAATNREILAGSNAIAAGPLTTGPLMSDIRQGRLLNSFVGGFWPMFLRLAVLGAQCRGHFARTVGPLLPEAPGGLLSRATARRPAEETLMAQCAALGRLARAAYNAAVALLARSSVPGPVVPAATSGHYSPRARRMHAWLRANLELLRLHAVLFHVMAWLPGPLSEVAHMHGPDAGRLARQLATRVEHTLGLVQLVVEDMRPSDGQQAFEPGMAVGGAGAGLPPLAPALAALQASLGLVHQAATAAVTAGDPAAGLRALYVVLRRFLRHPASTWTLPADLLLVADGPACDVSGTSGLEAGLARELALVPPLSRARLDTPRDNRGNPLRFSSLLPLAVDIRGVAYNLPDSALLPHATVGQGATAPRITSPRLAVLVRLPCGRSRIVFPRVHPAAGSTASIAATAAAGSDAYASFDRSTHILSSPAGIESPEGFSPLAEADALQPSEASFDATLELSTVTWTGSSTLELVTGLAFNHDDHLDHGLLETLQVSHLSSDDGAYALVHSAASAVEVLPLGRSGSGSDVTNALGEYALHFIPLSDPVRVHVHPLSPHLPNPQHGPKR
ncbi:hypothetical protein H696_00729 [Fonticula alba]|uniref:Uncharacterized protein n=1 Tax=Fonticula alba TaxID=691883 RepID=A0A058ZGU3_FONAL|nr:hypothetical protein H696_00729 [Fonticula alba]KCV73186.1 hypothetical protein H696_00729 [Fonticula alba]|eukprot:XP_009492887.1 hypothetical protein H696_00729 [Fonticula alba]